MDQRVAEGGAGGTFVESAEADGGSLTQNPSGVVSHNRCSTLVELLASIRKNLKAARLAAAIGLQTQLATTAFLPRPTRAV